MQTQKPPAAPPARTYTAVLKQSRRITPDTSREEVRHLVFHAADQSFDAAVGNCIRVMASGQFGNAFDVGVYSMMDVERRKDGTQLAI